MKLGFSVFLAILQVTKSFSQYKISCISAPLNERIDADMIEKQLEELENKQS